MHGLETVKTTPVEEYIPEEPDWILNGRIKWLKRISKGLESLSEELNIPHAAERSTERQREINRKWNDISTVDHKLKGIRPIYAASDLYEKRFLTQQAVFKTKFQKLPTLTLIWLKFEKKNVFESQNL